jgi:hypothetical protein
VKVILPCGCPATWHWVSDSRQIISLAKEQQHRATCVEQGGTVAQAMKVIAAEHNVAVMYPTLPVVDSEDEIILLHRSDRVLTDCSVLKDGFDTSKDVLFEIPNPCAEIELGPTTTKRDNDGR